MFNENLNVLFLINISKRFWNQKIDYKNFNHSEHFNNVVFVIYNNISILM